MNGYIRDLAFLTAGAVIGYFVSEHKDDILKFVKSKLNKEEFVEEIPEEPDEVVPEEGLTEDDTIEANKLIFENKYAEFINTTIPNKECEPEPERILIEDADIEHITEEEFEMSEFAHFEKVYLTYFEDQERLVDLHNDLDLEDKDLYVGANFVSLFDDDPDAVLYIRNHKMEVDFEITKDRISEWPDSNNG